MADSEERLSYILILLFSLLFIILYFIYIGLVFNYVIKNYSKKKITIYWLQYIITCLSGVVFAFIYLCLLMKSKGNRINPFDDNDSREFIILITILLCLNTYIIINNLIFDSFSSFLLSFNLYKIFDLNTLDFNELFLKIKNIKTNLLKSKEHSIFWAISVIIDIILIIIFEFEYLNFEDDDTTAIFRVKNYVSYFLKYLHFSLFIILIFGLIVMKYFRQKFFLKNYYNTDKFATKIYYIKSCEIIYNSDIITVKTYADLLINIPILVFLFCKACTSFFLVFTEVLLYLYILILGALYFKIDKLNEVGKISKNIKFWFLLHNIHFSLGIDEHDNIINENTYKYSREEKQNLKKLNMGESENIIDNDKIKIYEYKKIGAINEEESKIELNEESFKSERTLSLRKTKSKMKKKILDFGTNAELYILYKLLMLYFEKNENIYLNVQNKISEDGTPFKNFFVQQNITKNKRIKARQTFGGSNAIDKKNKFMANIERISRISKINSSSITPFLKYKENKIFFSLEEKELKEEFKQKFNFLEQEATFKIESLSSNAFFELFPFYQISISDIIKSLNPSDNRKLYNILINRNKKNLDKAILESESENNLYYTYNSLLMMEVYEHEEFISFDELKKFTLSYGTYLLDTIKNINYTFIPLILGVFNIEICGENKVIILYRNPLYFSNFSHFNHWINFYITEGPEKIKASILQDDVIDINEIEVKNSLKMNESDYDEIINSIKRDFNFFMKMNIQVYPIIHLFIGDEKGDKVNINDANESSIMGGDISLQQNNLSGLLNNFEDGGLNNNINTKNDKLNQINEDDLYMTENNSLVDKEYYSMTGFDIHTLKIYFTHFFRLDCELNRNNDKNDNMILKSNHYCQYLEGQLQSYLTKTSLFELDDNENN